MRPTPGWRLLQVGSVLPAAGAVMLRRAAETLSRFVPISIAPALEGGLPHEAGRAPDRAALLAATLADGTVAVLANGPGSNALRFGDAPLGEVLAFLPQDLGGTVIGSMPHAHVLSALRRRHPGLRALIGPPVVEGLGGLEDPRLTEAAARDLVTLAESGPRSGPLVPAETWRAPRFPNPDMVVRSSSPEPVRPVAVRTGRAAGPVVAGHLSALRLLVGGPDWPDWSGSIVLAEIAELSRLNVDRLLKGLRGLGALDRLGAFIVGVPTEELPTRLDPSLSAVVAEATAGATYPVAVNAFVGSAVPSPYLELGARAAVEIGPDAVHIEWLP